MVFIPRLAFSGSAAVITATKKGTHSAILARELADADAAARRAEAEAAVVTAIYGIPSRTRYRLRPLRGQDDGGETKLVASEFDLICPDSTCSRSILFSLPAAFITRFCWIAEKGCHL